jgi:hypothetical protein
MNTQKLIEQLEGVVRKRTPTYVSMNNPKADKKLMQAHYLLAKLYGGEGNPTEAHAHFREAEHEFFNMCRAETQKTKYISGGLEGFRRFREQERKTERKLEGYRSKLFGIADESGYDATSLLLAQTSANPKKDNLVDIIKEYAA